MTIGNFAELVFADPKLVLQMNEKELQQWLNHELEVAVRINEVRTAYEKQTDA